MSTPEGRVKDKVKRRLEKEYPGCYRFMPVQNGMGNMTVDMLYCIKGLFVGIETKATPKPGHKEPDPTPRQQTVMNEIMAAGGMAFLIYDDVTLDRAVSLINLHLEFGANRNAA
jgi:hypothetical protein